MIRDDDDPLGPEQPTDSKKVVLRGDLRRELNINDVKIVAAIIVAVGSGVAAVIGYFRADTREVVQQVTEVQAQKHDALVNETRQNGAYVEKRLDKIDRSQELIMDKLRVPDIVRPVTPEKPLPPPLPPPKGGP